MKKHKQLSEHYKLAREAELEGNPRTAFVEIEHCLDINHRLDPQNFQQESFVDLLLIQAWAALKLDELHIARMAISSVQGYLARKPSTPIDAQKFDTLKTELLARLPSPEAKAESIAAYAKAAGTAVDIRTKQTALLSTKLTNSPDALLSELETCSTLSADNWSSILKKSIRLRYEDFPPGPEDSKLGGLPFLPDETEWPRSAAGSALSFLCQLNLAQLPPNELPQTGYLFFFYDAEEQPWGPYPEDCQLKVIYRSSSSINPTASPQDLKPDFIFPERSLKTSYEETAPSLQDAIDSEMPITNTDDYTMLLEAYYGKQPWHRIGGYAQQIQNSLQDYCNVCRPDETSEWRLLLQLDSDQELGMCWGDVGMLYFMISLDDLVAKRFDRIELNLQCY